MSASGESEQDLKHEHNFIKSNLRMIKMYTKKFLKMSRNSQCIYITNYITKVINSER